MQEFAPPRKIPERTMLEPARMPRRVARRLQLVCIEGKESPMEFRKPLYVVAIAAGLLLLSADAEAKKAKEYQVTGPVVAVDDNVVTIQKEDEKWEIELGSDVKVEGKLKPGEKVTIYYHMVANKVEKKGDVAKDGKESKKK
jgi:hypothetical protein